MSETNVPKRRESCDGINDTLNRPICTEFIGEAERCTSCGYLTEEHIKRSHAPIWGNILFVNELETGESSVSEMVCVGNYSNAAGVLNFMVKEWKLQPPNLVVSVLGGAANARVDPFLRERLREGLVKAVSTTDSWIITSGTNNGLTKVVGEAVKQAQYQEWVGEQQSSVKCIGINSWGCIDNHESMETWFSGPRRKQQYRYKVKQKTEVGMLPLTSSHSYFILADCCRRKLPDQESALRCNIERLLSESGMNPNDNHEIPIVVVLVGGNENSFKSIANSLSAGIPVVLCDGIGGASEILATALGMATERNTNENEKWLPPEKEDIVRKQIKDAFFSMSSDSSEIDYQLADILSAISRCLQKDLPITLFRVGKSGLQSQELDAAILHALLQGKVAQNRDQLELALTWDRDDVASTDILSNEMDICGRANINKLMLRAIIERKSNFVKLFMECGFVMKDFLTARRLEILYNNAVQTNEVLAWLLQKIVKSPSNGRRHYSLKDVSKLLFDLIGTELAQKANKDDNDLSRTFDYPFVELCIWAILANRKDMSLFFWAHAKEPIMLALLASKLWSALADRLWPGEDVFEPEFQANSDEYQDLAVGVIDECYKTDHDLSKLLVEEKSLIWKGKTRMDVAVRANCKAFLATACVQASVESYWKGNMRCKFLQIIWCLLNPFAIKNLDISINSREKYMVRSNTKQHVTAEDDKVQEDCSYEDLVESKLLDCNSEGVTISDNAARVLIDNDEDLSMEVRFFAPLENIDDSESEQIPYCEKLSLFYTAPVTKFITHSAAYIIFLFLFSWMVLQLQRSESEDDKKKHQNFGETVVVILAISYSVEEVRQLVTEDARWSKKLVSYLQSEWNIIDVCYLTMIFIAYTMSLLDEHETAAIIYGLVTLLLWIRVIRLYQAVDRLGPLWIMMRKMFKEMLIFITVLVVFLLGYGICTVALMQKKTPKKSLSKILMEVFLMPSLQMFGELFLEKITDSSYTSSSKSCGSSCNNTADGELSSGQASFQASLTVWLLAGYLLLGNVLILNLLIAIFGHIYEIVAENSTIEWKNEMYLLCEEYSEKPVLPPPFSMVETIVTALKAICIHEDNEKSLPPVMLERLRIFESYCAGLYRNEKESRKTLDENIRTLSEHAEEEMEKINDMINIVDFLRQDLESEEHKCKTKKRSKKPKTT